MQHNPQLARQIKALMEDERWQAIEQFTKEFLVSYFVATSIKRETEFDTIWYAASQEGGKEYILKFFADLENYAGR